ncbi:MAG: hypothetical protein K9G30_06960 [Parvibaculum sp.]|nr:hypothetical protein [Parvibaculum sp.]
MPCRLSDMLRRYRRNERGVISVMAAGALVLALAVAMVVIDSGSMLYARRSLQAATDAAALGAVRQIGDANAAEAASSAIFAMNGYSYGGDDMTVPGVYEADPAKQPESRFTPAGGGGNPTDINAVRVTKYAQSPTYFARLFGFGDVTAISAISTAAYTKTASFSAGTRLASLNDGLANQLLGGLLGTTVNLDLVDYTALAHANVDAIAFLDALATVKSLDAGTDTYGDLLETDVTLGDLAIAAQALDSEDCTGEGCTGALDAMAKLPAGPSVSLGDILGAAPFLERTIGSVGSSANGDQSFNLYDLVSGTAMAAGTGQAVAFDFTASGLAPLASVSGTITVGEPMAHMAIGKVGDSVQTSQVTVQIEATIDTGIPALVDSKITVPIRITAAEGVATVAAIPCARDATMVTLSGTTGAVTARYGTEGDSTPVISVKVGGLVDIVELNAGGAVQLGSGAPTPVSFTQDDIDNETLKTISSNGSVLSGLGNAFHISGTRILGLSIPGLDVLLNTIQSTVPGVVSSASTALDPVLDSLLTTLGVNIGEMDMIVHGARCNAPVLVS